MRDPSSLHLLSAAEEPSLPRVPPHYTAHPSPFYAALANQLRSVFGTGLLAMPFAVKRVGVPAALVLTLVIGVWSTYTMQLLAWSVCLLENRRSRAPSYEQLVSAAFGKLLGRACTANLVLSQIATCSAYLVFIGENLAQVVGVESYKVMQALLLPFVLLCWVRDMRTLMATSALGAPCELQ